MKLPARFAQYQPTLNQIEKAIHANQNVIWGVSVSSGILAGWATYASRKHHQKRIEATISSVTDRFETLEEDARRKAFWKITVPACVACSLIGYGIGRGHGSYKSYKFFDNYRNSLYQQMSRQMQTFEKENMLNTNSINNYLKKSFEIPDDDQKNQSFYTKWTKK